MASIKVNNSIPSYGQSITISCGITYNPASQWVPFYTEETLKQVRVYCGTIYSKTVWSGSRGGKSETVNFTYNTGELPLSVYGKAITVEMIYYRRDWLYGEGNATITTSFKLAANPDWRPTITMEGVRPLGTTLDGKLVAGISKLQAYGINTGYNPPEIDISTNGNVYYYLGSTGYTFKSSGWSGPQTNLTWDAANPIPTSDTDYDLRVRAFVSDAYASVGKETYVHAYGYYVPKLTTSSYITRVDEHGNIDGQGLYGRLFLQFDVASVDGSNRMTDCVVEKIDRNTLERSYIVPSRGSLELGYFEYNFAASKDTDSYFIITLTDRLKTNTIENWNLPAATIPLSLYDDGQGKGVCVGRMATEPGFWLYDNLYIKSSDLNSGKVYQLKINDAGEISTALVKTEEATLESRFQLDERSIGLSDLDKQWRLLENDLSVNINRIIKIVKVENGNEKVLIEEALNRNIITVPMENGYTYKWYVYLQNWEYTNPAVKVYDQNNNIISEDLIREWKCTATATYKFEFTDLPESLYIDMSSTKYSILQGNKLYSPRARIDNITTGKNVNMSYIASRYFTHTKNNETLRFTANTDISGDTYPSTMKPLVNIRVNDDGNETVYTLPKDITKTPGHNISISVEQEEWPDGYTRLQCIVPPSVVLSGGQYVWGASKLYITVNGKNILAWDETNNVWEDATPAMTFVASSGSKTIYVKVGDTIGFHCMQYGDSGVYEDRKGYYYENGKLLNDNETSTITYKVPASANKQATTINFDTTKVVTS